jgi:hypothetical protein
MVLKFLATTAISNSSICMAGQNEKTISVMGEGFSHDYQ